MNSAVVINWNGRHYLEACLTALLAQEPAPDEVILVDNHSDDGSRELVAEQFPTVKVLDTGYNAGPGYARNMGVQAARHERVLLLDNDVTMQPGALRSMIGTLDRNPAAALVQARSVCADDPRIVHYDSTDVQYLGLLVLHNWFVTREQATVPPGPVGGLVALCFLADRERYLDIGGFNPDLFILFEDTDFALRLRMRGGQILLDPESIVHHGGGTKDISMRGPLARYPARRVFLHSRNRWLVLLTCLRLRSLLVLLPAQLAYEVVQMVFACVRGHPIAWLHGKFALLGFLPRVSAWRRAAQAGRVIGDRELLVAGPLTLNPGLAERGLKRVFHSILSGGFTAWWNVFGRICG